MKNSAIFLAASLVLAAVVVLPVGSVTSNARDIFEGMERSKSTESPFDSIDDDLEEPQEEVISKTCIESVLPKDSIDLKKANEMLNKAADVEEQMPGMPFLPDLSTLWNQVGNVLQLPKFSEMNEQIKAIIDGYRGNIEDYIKRWVGFFNKKITDGVGKMKSTVSAENEKIKQFFANNFEEYKDVCLPDTNDCLKSIQKNLKQYKTRLNGNMAACEKFAERQLNQHQQWVENEASNLKSSFLHVTGCFEAEQLAGNVATCVGNSISNVFQLASKGIERFSQVMKQASDSFSLRMEKFKQCVVDRRRLLAQGETRIADKAKRCLQKQQSNGQVDIFV